MIKHKIENLNTLNQVLKSEHLSQEDLQISLSYSNINENSVQDISQALRKFTNLTSLGLDLRSNVIDNKGASVLGSGFKNLNLLSSLTINLSNNSIGNQGISELGSAIFKNSNLSSLDLKFSINSESFNIKFITHL
ncbi:hypothetical protein ABPG73_006325 [Tetrahymena malaccensis]